MEELNIKRNLIRLQEWVIFNIYIFSTITLIIIKALINDSSEQLTISHAPTVINNCLIIIIAFSIINDLITIVNYLTTLI